MAELVKQNLYERNNKIIEVVMKEIQEKCPDAIDLIGIAGSFCNGDIYDKSDLDLVIIYNDEKAKCLDKCFIINDVAFDVYTQGWDRFEVMAQYTQPYVTKLFDLNIIYSHDEDVLKKYKHYQNMVQDNMRNEEFVNKQVGRHFGASLTETACLDNVTDIGVAYRIMARIIREIEFTLFMLNKTYVKRGTKRVPEEIASLEILPQDFLPIYNKIVNCKTLEEIKVRVDEIIKSVKALLDSMNISYEIKEASESVVAKREISAADLPGTYEEIYSNWRNKMYHAVDINSAYLSFVTMNSCQEFYDEMADDYDIPRIELLVNYNPDDKLANATFFDEALNEWKKLYDMFGLEINYYANLEEFENLYKDNNKDESKKI